MKLMNMEIFILNIKNGFLKPKKDKDGYLQIALAGEKKPIYVKIATLVAYHYIGKPPTEINDATIDHINGIKNDNYYKNLRWLERSKNTSIANKISQIGEKNNQAILKEYKVYEICELLLKNLLTLKEIAEIYKVNKSTIYNIKAKKTWKGITENYTFPKVNIIRDEKGRFNKFSSTGR